MVVIPHQPPHCGGQEYQPLGFSMVCQFQLIMIFPSSSSCTVTWMIFSIYICVIWGLLDQSSGKSHWLHDRCFSCSLDLKSSMWWWLCCEHGSSSQIGILWNDFSLCNFQCRNEGWYFHGDICCCAHRLLCATGPVSGCVFFLCFKALPLFHLPINRNWKKRDYILMFSKHWGISFCHTSPFWWNNCALTFDSLGATNLTWLCWWHWSL